MAQCDDSDAEEMLKCGIDAFRKEFKVAPEVAGCAPGRVNLIGEHTDYNDGFVLPMALPMVTILVGRKNNKESCYFVTTAAGMDGSTTAEFPVPSKQPLKPGLPKWANYVKGVVANFKGEVPGFDALIVSNVPIGGGLSSSAALEVATYTFLEALTKQINSNLSEKALACQRAEHDFAGVPCGIMDQFISVMGSSGSALLIDCRSLDATQVKMDDPDIVLLVTNSNVKHELTGGEYAMRKKQCEEAAGLLKVKKLRDATITQLKELVPENKMTVVHRRARHVILEIDRTQHGSKALMDKDFVAFGALMVQSHNSLRDDYEVSCPELDALVEAALQVKGVLGSRMTGGGFGGCTVTLVKKGAVDTVKENITKKYKGSPTFYTAVPSAGCRILEIHP